jgi:ssDNA thymidine ADP-ribosyltransferase, DarT
MRREELEELHYITPLENLASICLRGILSHRRAQTVRHTSVAMEDIQDRRSRKTVPGGRSLHEYVNLYFHARNPMMYKRHERHVELCVLRVNAAVLDLEGVVVTDANAAAEDCYVRFAPAPEGLRIVDRAETFALRWTSANYFEQCRLKSRKCAEVLVPDRVEPQFLDGVYVSCDEARAACEAMGLDLTVTVNGHIFFNE